MSKKQRDFEADENCSNKVKIVESLVDENSPLLPIEIIMEIFGHLYSITDIHNCMTLSKEIRDEIFRTPKIMRKMITKTDKYNWNNFLKFISHKGEFLRNVEFNFRVINVKFMRFALHQLPHLEDMRHEYYIDEFQHDYYVRYSDVPDISDPVDMINLKKLTVNDYFDKITKIIKNARKIEKIICYFDEKDSLDGLTNLITQQNNLKELTVRNINFFDNRKYPNRNISSEVKFKLKLLKLKKGYNDNPHFLTFLQTQADSLEDLTLREPPDDEIYKIIFKMCKNLKKLDLDFSKSTICSEFYSDYKSESVKYLKDRIFTTSSLTETCRRFPNLDSIKCIQFENVSGIFDNIQVLEINDLRVDDFQNIQLPNLKQLVIFNYINSEDENNLEKFMQNIPNIEIFQISSIKLNLENLQIFKFLKSFRKIRIFCAEFHETFETLYIPDGDDEEDWIQYAEDPLEHRIVIDFKNKTAKCFDELFEEQLLRENFIDFQFSKQEYRDFDYKFLESNYFDSLFF